MTTYRIVAPQFVAGLVVASNTVIQAAPILHWTIGKDWEGVRTYCQQRGWNIEPLTDLYQPEWLEVNNHVYELKWNGEVLKRVTLHEDGETRDLCYNELPDLIKSLL